MDPKHVSDYFSSNQAAIMQAIQELVEMESPTHDKSRVDALGGRIRQRFEALGCSVHAVDNPEYGNHLMIDFAGGAAPDVKPGLVMGHMDTVWPVGTLAEMPFQLQDGCAHGPGIFDMKSGIVAAEFAIRASLDLGHDFPRPIRILLTCDEEIGSPSSRQLIEETAAQAEYVLVPEPPMPGGGLKTQRKGVGYFEVSIHGRPAHAGLEPENGRSAIIELAHQILFLEGLNDNDAGSTVNVGVVSGGTRSNVIAAEAGAVVDLRVWSMAEAGRLEQEILNLKPVTKDVTLSVTGGMNRPPMEKTTGNQRLFEAARKIAAGLGQAVGEGAAGGGSDGSLTSALGIPTLDGLGPPGRGPHAPHEHIVVDALPGRCALIAALLFQL